MGRSAHGGAGGKGDGAVQLSPDEIQGRTFAIADGGYDCDEVRSFLVEVASTVRLARHTTLPPTVASSAPGASDGAPHRTAPDDFAHLGSEVATVLRAAHAAAETLRVEAERSIAERHQDAAAQADEILHQAATEAAWTSERARRVLITAQEQAEAIAGEAEAAAVETIDEARRQAKDHTDQVVEHSRRHADQILRAEREALRRLHDAQHGIADAIDTLTDPEIRPVVDLTAGRPNLNVGSLPFEPHADIAPDHADDPRPDPVAQMIRRAVGRAASQGASSTIDVERSSEPDTGGPRSVPTPGAFGTSTAAESADAPSATAAEAAR